MLSAARPSAFFSADTHGCASLMGASEEGQKEGEVPCDGRGCSVLAVVWSEGIPVVATGTCRFADDCQLDFCRAAGLFRLQCHAESPLLAKAGAWTPEGYRYPPGALQSLTLFAL